MENSVRVGHMWEVCLNELYESIVSWCLCVGEYNGSKTETK